MGHSPLYYKGAWQFLCICGVLGFMGLRMVWSSFRPVDDYTRRLRGDQPLWGRFLGIILGLLFAVVGLGGIGLSMLGESFRYWR